VPSGSHFHLEKVNRMGGIRFSIFLKKKTEGPFGHFYRDNFDIFKTYGGAGRGYWGAERICLHIIRVCWAQIHASPTPWRCRTRKHVGCQKLLWAMTQLFTTLPSYPISLFSHYFSLY